MYGTDYLQGRVGWECPKCGAPYAPWMASCTRCVPTATGQRDRLAADQLPLPRIGAPLRLVNDELAGTDPTDGA